MQGTQCPIYRWSKRDKVNPTGWGGALADETRRQSVSHVLPPQRTAAAGSAASAQMQPSSSSSSSAAASAAASAASSAAASAAPARPAVGR